MDDSSSIASWKSQVRKGILEYLVLRELADGSGYGYEILQRIRSHPAMEVTESAVYPIVNRLAKEGLLKSIKEKSNMGPPRRRYSITPLGKVRLLHMSHFMNELKTTLSE